MEIVKGIILGILGLLLIVIVVFLYFVSPARARKKKWGFMNEKVKFAHRGLYNNPEIPENSMKAFQKAMEHGYAIEMDVRLTKDQKAVVFHDNTLSRMCGIQEAVLNKTLEEITACTLLGTEERIPTFADFLTLIDGKVPLLIEYKTGLPGSDVSALCEETWKVLKDYKGAFVIESFDYKVLEWFRKHHPEVIRGMLSMGLHCYKPAMGKQAAEKFPLKQQIMLT